MSFLTLLGAVLAVLGLLGLLHVLALGLVLSLVFIVAGIVLVVMDRRGTRL